MLISLTVGKVDAGVAVLLTEDKRLIEFPSILLPPSITSGSIVDITVARNHQAEQKSQSSFSALQDRILNTYGLHSPKPPNLRLRTATQTSLVLEWDPIQLATSSLKSLSLYRNGSKAGSIPRPMDMLSTKISGLAVDTEYSFHMVLRTSGGTYSSPLLTVRTHKMTDLSGITVTPGYLPDQLRSSLEAAVQRIGARIVDTVRIDTTHFVCTEGRGTEWERALQMSIPVVRPEWIEGCEREGRITGVRDYYLDANPKKRQVGSNPAITSTWSHSSSTTAVAPGPGPNAGSQTSLPSRSAPPAPPMTPDKDGQLSPDGEGPGPTLPPTPMPKNTATNNPAPPPPPPKDTEDRSATEEESEEESEDEELPSEKEIERSRSMAAQKQKAKVEDAAEGSGDMDEVPL